jgi:ABC-type phosphate transport system substrate-binding protein
MRLILISLTTLSATLVATIAYAEPQKPIIAVIAASGKKVPDLKLSKQNLNLIYWRKQQFWPKGLRIKPVNLSAQHPLRLQFSQVVLGNTPKAQIDYWNGQYFNGILPPYSVKSEEAVLRYVAQTKGAIGYINACQLDDRVLPLLWVIDSKITGTPPKHINCD